MLRVSPFVAPKTHLVCSQDRLEGSRECSILSKKTQGVAKYPAVACVVGCWGRLILCRRNGRPGSSGGGLVSPGAKLACGWPLRVRGSADLLAQSPTGGRGRALDDLSSLVVSNSSYQNGSAINPGGAVDMRKKRRVRTGTGQAPHAIGWRGVEFRK